MREMIYQDEKEASNFILMDRAPKRMIGTTATKLTAILLKVCITSPHIAQAFFITATNIFNFLCFLRHIRRHQMRFQRKLLN